MLPIALLLTACTTVNPAFENSDPRVGSCINGGPDMVAQKFYNLRIEQKNSHASLPNNTQMAQLQPYLSRALYQDLQVAKQQNSQPATAKTDNRWTFITGDIFTSQPKGVTHATVASASTIPNSDARNIPLRVNLTYKPANSSQQKWQDEVLMIREGGCWVIDDIRFMGDTAPASTLRQLLAQP